MKGNYVPGSGSPSAKLLIVGEAPRYHEDQKGEPFVGPSGRLLDELLLFAGTSRSEVYITNVYKYRPPQNKVSRIGEILSSKEIENSFILLDKEIEAINPNVILPLGNIAIKAVTDLKNPKVTNLRGSILKDKSRRRKVIPTYHPANLLPGSPSQLPYSARAYIQLDILKAVRESKTKEFHFTERNLFYAKSSLDIEKFLRRFEDSRKDTLAVDIETYHSIPTCISFSFDPNIAMSVPLMLMKGIDEIIIQDYDLQEMWRLVGEILYNDKIKKVGQNFKFDQERLRNTCLMEVRNFHADTMLIAHTLYPEFPKGLYFLTSIYTNEPYYKDEYKDFNPKKDPVTQVLLYNAKDAAVTLEVYEEQVKELYESGLTDFYFNYIHKLHGFYLELEDVGFKFNTWKQKWIRRKYEILARRSEQELFSLIDKPFDPKFINSPKKIANLLFGELGFPERSNTEEDTLVALLSNHTNGKPERARLLNLILDTRRLKKTVSTYLSAPPDYDGRMRSSYKIVGTETGRSSTAKYGNKVKGGGRKSPTRPSEVGLAFQTVPERGPGKEIQGSFEADEGYELFSIDLSQAEARVVALLAEDYELLTLFNTIDIHKRTASWFFKKLEGNISKEERFIGKIGRHGGNYDMKKARLCNTIMSEARKAGIGVIISERQAGEILVTFHNFTPKIKSVFHKGIQEALKKNNRVLVTPHGRMRKFFDRWSEDLFREAYAYIPQATVRDHLSQAGLRIKKIQPRIQFLKESHDAFKGQYPLEIKNECREILRNELSSPIDFSKCSLPRGKLIIPSELQVGFNLGRMSKI